MADQNLAREIAALFQLPAPPKDVEIYPGGHINDSFLISCASTQHPRFLLQRLNADVFPRPDQIMENIRRVSEHVQSQSHTSAMAKSESTFLSLVVTKAGQPYTRCGAGDVWRMYEFIEGSTMHESAATPAEARQAGLAFGEFQVLLADLPGPDLHEIIEDFHDTPKRLENLRAVVNADPLHRAEHAKPEIKFALDFAQKGNLIVAGMRDGTLARRTVHNDAKMSNVLLDRNTGHRLCVIDLDTVMPGSVLYDFGDMMRTMLCNAPEDETDLSKVNVDMEMFQALADGYLRGARSILNQAEMDMLVFSGILITIETGSRFLADHLEGDHYFRIHRPDQNLDRARCQFELARSMMAQRADMEARLAVLAAASTAAVAK